MEVLGGWAVSYERGTPVQVAALLRAVAARRLPLTLNPQPLTYLNLDLNLTLSLNLNLHLTLKLNAGHSARRSPWATRSG
jgi:hypothetical protein